MLSTMQDRPLLVTDVLRHGQQVHGRRSQVITFDGGSFRRTSFAEVAARAERLAAALRRLGVGGGDRVATFCMNHQEHLETYLAAPSMGAVLHTLNVRLFADQLQFVIDDAEDKVILVDAALAPALAKVVGGCPSVERLIVVGDGDASMLGPALDYEELLAAEDPGFEWPELDERSAAAMCYTSGTTGNPKGVVYSHRSTWLHTLAATSSATLGISSDDTVLVIVPQFHANAWGLPYAGWLAGADIVMPRQFTQPEPLARIMAEQRPTLCGAVPTIWNDLLAYSKDHPVDLSSLRVIICGGSAVPQHLMESYDSRFGLPIVQAWGMTETSPLGAIARPARGTPADELMGYRLKTGRVVPGVEIRVVDPSGAVAPHDGATVGEFEVRGPWITASYYRDDSGDRFDDGWLRTGDVGVLDADGFMQITDRAKDVIKTGGEWISSVELENAIMGHPAVHEAAVIAVADDRYDERPLAFVVLREGAEADAAELAAFLDGRVARWWVPERWTRIDAVPRTSVGKFDKKALRSRLAAGDVEVEMLERSRPAETG